MDSAKMYNWNVPIVIVCITPTDFSGSEAKRFRIRLLHQSNNGAARVVGVAPAQSPGPDIWRIAIKIIFNNIFFLFFFSSIFFVSDSALALALCHSNALSKLF